MDARNHPCHRPLLCHPLSDLPTALVAHTHERVATGWGDMSADDLFQHTQPVSIQHLLDLVVAETALDQTLCQVAGVAVVGETRRRVSLDHGGSDGGLLFGRPVTEEKLDEVKADAHGVDAGQVSHIGDVIDIVVEGRLFFL